MLRKILGSAAVALAAAGLGVAPTAAGNSGGGGTTFSCNGTYSGGTYGDITVPTNGVCILSKSTINGNVTAGTNAYFEASSSKIVHDVVGNSSLTLYVWGHSTVNGDLIGNQTAQVFVWDSKLALDVDAANGLSNSTYYGHLQLCGNTITHDVNVSSMRWEVLIGDPAATCARNTVQKGAVNVSSNSTDQELYIIGNLISNGNLTVTNNTGGGPKYVGGNTVPHGTVSCSGNTPPFTGCS